MQDRSLFIDDSSDNEEIITAATNNNNGLMGATTASAIDLTQMEQTELEPARQKRRQETRHDVDDTDMETMGLFPWTQDFGGVETPAAVAPAAVAPAATVAAAPTTNNGSQASGVLKRAFDEGRWSGLEYSVAEGRWIHVAAPTTNNGSQVTGGLEYSVAEGRWIHVAAPTTNNGSQVQGGLEWSEAEGRWSGLEYSVAEGRWIHVAAPTTNNGSQVQGGLEWSEAEGTRLSPIPPIAPRKKKQKKSKTLDWRPPPKAMEKGKALAQPTGFDCIDMYYPHLKAAQRTAVLHFLVPFKTKQFLHQWRVSYEKKVQKSTLWSMAAAVADTIAVEQQHATSSGRENDNNEKPPPSSLFLSDNAVDGKQPPPLPVIGSLSGTVLQTLQTYFDAYCNRVHHKKMLDMVEPACNNDGAIPCTICSDTFDPIHTVPCSGQEEVHFFCKPCFYSYVTVTVQSGPIQSIACPCPECDALFATHDATANVSEWDVLRMADREHQRNCRVALAAQAVLHCECGVVGIITKEDIGNGRVACPGCLTHYCCHCGNHDHGTEPCPPPAETVQWLNANTKECPNCQSPIEKNGGCDHMTCHVPEGCGHQFWWTCLCPFPQHKPDCSRHQKISRMVPINR